MHQNSGRFPSAGSNDARLKENMCIFFFIFSFFKIFFYEKFSSGTKTPKQTNVQCHRLQRFMYKHL